jgi:hypothetical protein
MKTVDAGITETVNIQYLVFFSFTIFTLQWQVLAAPAISLQ